jgi:hypothetical protein
VLTSPRQVEQYGIAKFEKSWQELAATVRQSCIMITALGG